MTKPDTPHYLGHRQRLKAKLVDNSRSLADYEIMELVLAQVLPRRDTKPLAKELIDRFGSLKDAITARPDQLKTIKGIGPAVTVHWALLQELYARIGETQARSGQPLSDPRDVAQAAMARLGGKGVEEFWTAFLDSKNRVIAWEKIGNGTVNAAPVFPREIIAMALRLEAVSIILAHNHPGGDPTPSKEDVLLTGMIKEAARSLDITVHDHIVVTDTAYCSFYEEGYL
ncbi:DNA repair protein RadC [Pseudodesulfovibrio sp. JC047]|uniref:RadC family protein n=1 Tax=Pseudodesulfovibrio sp. JC047 TaxID=2683199 RepID=UPI0013D1F9FB|nr:DNA repair protein RadC [Pseudodesulfovibrio sp. JC047]NDV20394.1 DNA repair protein RadC [Pseudodesulfovibrio sp. JC047]